MGTGFGLKTANWGGADGGTAPGVRGKPGGIEPYVRVVPGVGLLNAAGVRDDGTAINAASGSRGAFGTGSAGSVGAAAIVGGGAIGLATSSGFSPGNTQTFRSLS